MTVSAKSPRRDAGEVVFHTVKETASYLRLCEKQVRRLISRGDLTAYRFGTALRIRKQDIDAFAEKRKIRAS